MIKIGNVYSEQRIRILSLIARSASHWTGKMALTSNGVMKLISPVSIMIMVRWKEGSDQH